MNQLAHEPGIITNLQADNIGQVLRKSHLLETLEEANHCQAGQAFTSLAIGEGVHDIHNYARGIRVVLSMAVAALLEALSLLGHTVTLTSICTHDKQVVSSNVADS